MPVLPRPGYVYVMANRSLPGWHKVGHTHRPPHRRAHELSRTALPTAFEVGFAKFFWDAPAAERVIHRNLTLAVGGQGRRKEFFNIPLAQARAAVEALGDAGRRLTCPSVDGAFDDDSWEDTLEGRESLWEWAEQDWGSDDPIRRREGWRTMERLSAAGWAEGSWRLSEHLVRADPSPDGGDRAAWVLDAARAQGMEEAGLRAAWLRSWRDEAGFAAWAAAAEKALVRWGPRSETWPLRAAETLRAEMTLWDRQPARRLQSAWLQQWDTSAAVEQPLKPAGPWPPTRSGQ